MAYVLGIDVSTTATKAVLVDESGAVARDRRLPSTASRCRSRSGASRTRALWWDGAVGGDPRGRWRRPASPATTSPPSGLTGQMHGPCCSTRRARSSGRRSCGTTSARRPSATRSARRVGPERLIAITGNDALTGFTAPKLVWVRDHEPDVWPRVAHVLLPKDYVRLRLTGELRAWTRRTAPGTLLFDLAARDWSPEVARRARDRPGAGCRRRIEGPR